MTENYPTSSDVVPMTAGFTLADLEAVQDLDEHALSASTLRRYQGLWDQFCRWCDGRGLAVLPAHPDTVRTYIAHRQAGTTGLTRPVARNGGDGTLELVPAVGTGTLQQDRLAIRWAHREAGEDDPTAAATVARTLKGARRKSAGRQPARAHAMSTEELRRILAGIDRDTPAGKRDAALLLIGFVCVLRRSELVALTIGDVQWSPRGVALLVRRSKSDQEGAGEWVAAERGRHPETDPVAALHDWLEARGTTDPAAPIFTRVRAGGHVQDTALTSHSVAAMIATRADAVGLRGGGMRWSGHSLRRGGITTGHRGGASLRHLQDAARHSSSATTEAYVQSLTAFDNSLTRALDL